jgi:hypothetical protein
MKKLTLLISALFLTVSLIAQVGRENVVVEIVTGTWCQYCPGAAMGADDLISNGHDVAIIEYHGGDDYQNTYSSSRISYYGTTGYPTAYFDGGSAVSGGSHTVSMYPQYLTKYNQKIAISSPVSIDLEATHACMETFNLNIVVEKVDNIASTNLKLHIVVTESEIAENWQGMDHLNFVERLMAPNQYGTTVDFSGGDVQEFEISFNFNDEWVFEHCELVVFVQDASTKQIFQAVKKGFMDIPPEYMYDASAKLISNVPEENCTGQLNPKVVIGNLGSEAMNSVEIVYDVNDGDPEVHIWSGSLLYLETQEVELPTIYFDPSETNVLSIATQNPNGLGDECPDNDETTLDFGIALITTATINLNLRLDDNPQETTYKLTDASGQILYLGGPFFEPNEFISETFDISEDGCYIFTMLDSGGNGLCCDYGIGFYQLSDSEGTILQQSQRFGSKEETQFEVDMGVGFAEEIAKESIKIYPNPFDQYATIEFDLQEDSDVRVLVYNLVGDIVMETDQGILSAGEQQIRIDRNEMNSGIYFVRLHIGTKIFTSKITIN